MNNSISQTKALVFSFLVISATFFACQKEENSQGENFLSKVDQNESGIVDDSDKLGFFSEPRMPIRNAYTLLPVGSTKPQGWLKEIMTYDLNEGIVGALDELYPGIAKDDIYNKNRRGGLDDVPEMGDLVLTGAAWEKSIMWWNAETIGNWWEGFIRHAFLLNNEIAIQQSKGIIDNLLASQDEDGYIGIYKSNLRYKHEGSNGELWAQTTAFRTMLAYYEFTKNPQVLNAVEKGMKLTIQQYGSDGKSPFYLKNAFGGVTHGLMLTDVCETLFRITGNESYRDYAIYLYQEFSRYSVNRAFNDLRYPYLTEKDSAFTGHAVHTYEHFRTLMFARNNTGYDELNIAFNNAVSKLYPCILPSGAGHGNEWIAGMAADPDLTDSEFCTMHELRHSLTSMMQHTGEMRFADMAEKLTFNGILGFRDKDGRAITYGKGDNSYIIDGFRHDGHDEHKDSRYKYSPVHSDPAVCCVPNYSRTFPYYLDYMWLSTDEGFINALYGPSQLTTSVDGTEIEIRSITDYPFSSRIQYIVSCNEPKEFSLYFRKPEWTDSISFEGLEAVNSSDQTRYKISNKWSQDTFDLVFNQNVELKSFSDEQHYFQEGALVFALPIEHEEEVIKSYELEGFRDFYCFPRDSAFLSMRIKRTTNSDHSVKQNHPTTGGLHIGGIPTLSVEFFNDQTRNNEIHEMLPMGLTTLRKVTFKAQ